MNNIYGYGGQDAQQQPYVDENDPYADVNPAVLQNMLGPQPQQQPNTYQPELKLCKHLIPQLVKYHNIVNMNHLQVAKF